MAYLVDFFEGIPYWTLRPAPSVLRAQPGAEDAARFISAAQSPDKSLTVVYMPEDRSVLLVPDATVAGAAAVWFNPRTGERTSAAVERSADALRFETPAPGDWVLLLRGAR
jgi:hypothetical protein